MRQEIVLTRPVPTTLLAAFSAEPPVKKRKTSNGRKPKICDVEGGEARLVEYLGIASGALKITFDKRTNGHGETNGDVEDGYGPVPVSLDLNSTSELKLSAEHAGVVLEETVHLDQEATKYFRDAGQLPSIYRPHTKTAQTCCYQATLQRDPGQHSSFLLDVRILWRNTLDIPGYAALSGPALPTFLDYVPGRPTTYRPTETVPTAKRSKKSKYDPQNHVWSPREFYDNVHVPDKTSDLNLSVGHRSMPTHLFPFQRRTVRWLLEREGIQVSPEGELVASPSLQKQELPPSFFRMRDADDRACYASHLCRTVSTDISRWMASESSLRGGILAEEMGLGKTVELLTLILLHRRPSSSDVNGAAVGPTGTTITNSGATLIITPTAILEQWKQEIAAHAPALQYVHYKGIRNTKQSHSSLVEELASCDIVLTTYNVLQQEVHYAEEPPDRYMRHQRRFARPQSPLVQISWWRVCIDEAQMVENGVSNAARVALIIPRCNAWAVTGTPIKKDMKDLYGLFLFLKYEPFCHSLDTWVRLCKDFKPALKTILGRLVLRHNKAIIRDELRLPHQKRVVITVPFTAVEEQNYDQLFQQMCDECGLDITGAPAVEHWDPNSGRVIEKMRSWLSRLRQACLHAEVRGAARKAFGMNGPLRSVSDVLEVMIDQNDNQIRAQERLLLQSQILRGQLLENALKPKEALNIWEDALARSEPIVRECRAQLEAELSKQSNSDRDPNRSELSDDDEDDEEKEEKLAIGKYRTRLRYALEVQHMCKFFIASAYYQIKTNEEFTAPESEEFHSLDKLEEETYEAAKIIRREMLSETNRKVSRYIHVVRDKVKDKGLTQIPTMEFDARDGGIESRRVLDRVEDFCEAMNKQAAQFMEWRGHMSQLVLQSLIDEEDGAELQGDEYESSTKHQDKMYVYMEALRVMHAHRHDAITGQKNVLIAHEVRQGLEMARNGEGPSPELYISLMEKCSSLRIPNELGSLRDILGELRSLATSLEWQEVRNSARARTELAIVNDILHDVSQMVSAQTKASSSLEKEVELFREVMNKRLEYYRQLQQISDTVAPYDEEKRGEPLDVMLFDSKRSGESKIEETLSTLKSKRRYLIHLRDESGAEESARICIICQSSFEIGVLTVCGHKYCKDCLRLWWHQHRTCPTCKNRLRTNDLHQITYKPTDLVAQEEKTVPAVGPDHSHNNSLYADVSSGVLREIKEIELRGSFGTKIDTLGRHIIWLRQHDPGAKSIVFSQYKPFLTILASAFSRFKIGFTSVDSRDGIERFKRESSMECFLLHAKAHSSGLNLVNATHVFLCEPLINTAIELQAVARVHRIGQHRETTVWMYLVSDTVEEAIYDISVSRRLTHIAQKQKEDEQRLSQLNGSAGAGNDDLGDITENAIESANTLELQEAALGKLMAGPATEGEHVSDNDLWQCLFGKSRKNEVAPGGEAINGVQNEVGRLLRANAAEARRDAADGPNGV